MNPPSAGASTSATSRLLTLLRSLGVTHLITVPDNTSAPIIDALMEEAAASRAPESAEGDIALILATREGEAMGLASGLWIGGGKPVVLIQNTGLLESGDGLRGTVARMGIPLLLLVTCRGFQKARNCGVDPRSRVMDRDILVRNDLDSVAFMTESTLEAWGIPHWSLSDPSSFQVIEKAEAQARDEERPVAVLLDTSFE